ncbi:hypothetical protein VC279_19910 [Xanthomonas sp. WHRI 10064A]|uniref:hypothetical protein n=1 Tax=unclassified Xanthomonas TaxID=2643310 RepID=UPI002B22D4ED|nr:MULTISPECIES: hypothetical protein [unclassified Xanthomonas]MEA9589197.1 hypothetical protein [Xanthomonas sp. WHRI 10064B]MEA9616880.1 hypothetical protein [Xanthomonas sp. WHRI 10064A]
MLWTADSATPDRSTVLIGVEDKETAGLHISCKQWPLVERVVVVRPAARPYVALISLLACVTGCQQACEADPFKAPILFRSLEAVDPTVRAIADALAAMQIGLRRFDGALVANASAALLDAQQRSPSIPASTAASFRMMAAFTENFGQGLLSEWSQPGFFVHDTHDSSNKNWWKNSPSLGSSIFRTSELFRTTVTGTHGEAFKEVRSWLDGLRGEVLKLHLGGNAAYSGGVIRSEGSAFRIASAFLTFSFDLHMDQGRYVLALMCLHRAAEWMMASLCDSNKMLVYTNKSGPRLRSSNESLTYSALLLELLAADSTALKGKEKEFESLNSWRNLLVYTHHMSAPKPDDAKDLLSVVRSTLPALGGKDWRDCLTVLKRPFPVQIADLIDPFKELRSGFSVSTPEELVAELGL